MFYVSGKRLAPPGGGGAGRGFNLGAGLTEPVATVTLWPCLVNRACAILPVFMSTHFVSCTIQYEETGLYFLSPRVSEEAVYAVRLGGVLRHTRLQPAFRLYRFRCRKTRLWWICFGFLLLCFCLCDTGTWHWIICPAGNAVWRANSVFFCVCVWSYITLTFHTVSFKEQTCFHEADFTDFFFPQLDQGKCKTICTEETFIFHLLSINQTWFI